MPVARRVEQAAQEQLQMHFAALLQRQVGRGEPAAETPQGVAEQAVPMVTEGAVAITHPVLHRVRVAEDSLGQGGML